MKLNLLCRVAVGCLAAVSLSGCLQGETDVEERRRDIDVEFSFGAEDIAIYHAMELLLDRAVAESGRTISVRYSYAYADIEQERRNVRAAIERRPDVLVIMPQDSRIVLDYIRRAEEVNIPVIVYNRAADPHPDIHPSAFVGLDTVDQAYTAAVALFQRMEEEGQRPNVINVMGDLRDRNALNRNAGLLRAAEEAGATILESVRTDWDPQLAEEALREALRRYPEANALFVASDWLMSGVRAALEEAGRWAPHGDPAHIYLGSQDVFPLGAELVRGGYIDVNTAFDIWPMSTTLVQSIVSIVAGDTMSQRIFLIPGRIVTRANIDEMDDLWHESLYDADGSPP